MDTTTQFENKVDEMKSGAAETVKQGARKLNRYTEQVASGTPSLLFMVAALASIAASATLQLLGKRQMALFVGHWAPSFLLFGLYNKMIKTTGAE